MVKIMYKINIVLILFLIKLKIQAQTVDLTEIGLKDIIRTNTLLDTNLPKESFLIRNSSYYYNTENPNWSKLMITRFGLLYLNQDNSHLPYGYNDGNMGNSVGKQKLYSSQLNIQWGRIYLQIAPEKIIANNESFDRLPLNFDGTQNGYNYWARYYSMSENLIENTIQIGSKETNFLGQSSLKYNTKNISFGISNENLWWGPGIYNSLILTNNAPGFLHFTINTHKPISNKFGNFEWQIIGGNLSNSNIEPINNDNPFARPYYVPKPNQDRYLTGLIITMQPKLIPNLYIGVANVAYMYKKEIQKTEEYTPFVNFNKQSELNNRPTFGSFFFKYNFPKDHAEFYLEYGRNNKAATPVNIFEDSIPTGYVGGARKIFPLGSNFRYGGIMINMEVVQMHLNNPNQIWDKDLITKRTSWYTNSYITQGYTNSGQILGSYIGPGSNAQNLQISWIKASKKIGIGIERVIHNQDFYYYNYYNGLKYPGPNFKYWADLIYNVSFRWDVGNFIFSADYKNSNSYNYMWTKIGDGGIYGPSDTDKKNIQINFAIKYVFLKK